jgi:glutathione S-transferase
MPQLTLISHALCPYVQRAAIALLEKGVPFERITIDLAAKPDWFLKISPLGKVPLLKVVQEDGSEAVLFESSVICEYLNETQPGASLHPADALQRARHRAWMEFGSALLGDIWGLETAQDAAVHAAKRAAIADKLQRVEDTLQTAPHAGPFFAGPQFSLVDAVFAPAFRYFDTFDRIADIGVFDAKPRIGAWRAALAARSSVRAAVDAGYGDKLTAFLHEHKAHLLSLARPESSAAPMRGRELPPKAVQGFSG